MSSEALRRISRVRMLLPTVAVVAFILMVAIAEYQIRSSPKWPPPARHELGAWQVDEPPLWTLAAAVNLPATVPILWMSALSDWFTYALDDHQLIIHVPWIIFVLCLWYLVAYHFDRFFTGKAVGATSRSLVFSAQVFISLELIYCAIGIIGTSTVKAPTAVVACFWAWVLAMVFSWVNLFRGIRRASVG